MAHFVPNRCRSISRVWAYTLAYYFFRFVSWPDRPIFGQQLDIESLGVVKRWQSVVEPKSAHLVLIGSAGIEG